MRPLVSLVAVASVIAALFAGGCTEYLVRVRTFPPTVGPVYIDDAFMATTSERGEAAFSSGSRSIFANPLLRMEADGKEGILQMDYSSLGEGVRHVGRVQVHKVGHDRYYDVIFAFQDDAVPLPPIEPTSGGTLVTLRNPNDIAVWIALREDDEGASLILLPHDSVELHLPDGRYEVFLVYTDYPDALVALKEDLEVDDEDVLFVVPDFVKRWTLTIPSNQ